MTPAAKTDTRHQPKARARTEVAYGLSSLALRVGVQLGHLDPIGA